MDGPKPPADQLPARIQWFAPWRWFPTWKPWQRWAIVVAVVLFGYVLSPVPTLWVVGRMGGQTARENVAFTVYLPIVAACEMMPSLDHHFYSPQDEWLRSVLGAP